MNKIIWAKPYLRQLNSLVITLMLGVLLSINALAKVNVSPFFIQLSDAMETVKRGETEKTAPILTALQADFRALPEHTSPAGRQVEAQLAQAVRSPTLAHLEQLSNALYAFEKEQNPVDYTQKRQQFAKRVLPVYEKLHQGLQAQNLEETQADYKRFNTTWTLNEKVVRETSLGHYGKIETAMSLFRIAMLSEPADFAEMRKQSELLGNALNDFKAGNVLQVETASGAAQTLPEGIKLLEKSYQAFENNQSEQARADITLFIQQWPIFEGDVRTRDGQLYNRVESELPMIMVKAPQAETMQQFQSLIQDLQKLDISGAYGVIDAMLILLREGTEALLIIMALLTTLNAANQPRAKRWVYGGAGLGIAASILGAVALQQLFPAVSAGTNREILEGAVGIFAVIMMLFVGAWLHSKASITGWKKFIDHQVTKAITTGSLFSMLSLSFLSVFREGAETILFYAGMLPLISLRDFLTGIGLALILLVIIAFVIHKSSAKLPLHHLFKVMTVLIYALGFKILGVSVHALQLTKIFPTDIIDGLGNLPAVGFYATWQGIGAQGLYLLLIPLAAKLFR